MLEEGLEPLVDPGLWKDCAVKSTPNPGAFQTAVCLPPAGETRKYDSVEISIYPDETALDAAYTARREAAGVQDGGACTGTRWGGAGPWVHPGDPPKPGGDRFCYFDGNEAVIVWTHQRLGQPNHRDMLAVAREGGTDHAGLFNWWRFWHHRIGKASA